MESKQNKGKETQNDKCLKCKHLDYSDIPNLFCNVTSELVNDGDFRYCPKNIKSVLAFIENQDKKMSKFESELLAYKNLGTLKTLAEDKVNDSSEIKVEAIPEGTVDVAIQISYKNKVFKLNNFELIELARLAGILDDDFVPKK